MTSETRQRLRELAEKATPGPWKTFDSGLAVRQVEGRYVVSMSPPEGGIDQASWANAAYIAAVSPDVVLELLDAPIDVERLARAIWTIAFQRPGEQWDERHATDGDEWYGTPRDMARDLAARLTGATE